ncbi:MAG: class I SAM-dependent methyltransferase [Pseudomonadota bacterium]|nr:class I SAM-dependent methyltransferase [Pseudomonadota bacterium]
MRISESDGRTHEYWDARFSEPGYAYGEHPNDFLRAAIAGIRPGEALSLAEGEGRNAVYLARLGFNVTAVDHSAVGLKKARELAAKHGVSITTELADLTDYDLGQDRWDLVLSIFSHPPSAMRQRLYRTVQRALRENGAFVLESKSVAGATDTSPYPGKAILRGELGPLRFAIAREVERDLDEGPYHAGMHRVVQILGFKADPLLATL